MPKSTRTLDDLVNDIIALRKEVEPYLFNAGHTTPEESRHMKAVHEQRVRLARECLNNTTLTPLEALHAARLYIWQHERERGVDEISDFLSETAMTKDGWTIIDECMFEWIYCLAAVKRGERVDDGLDVRSGFPEGEGPH